jgi:hypothetical protein
VHQERGSQQEHGAVRAWRGDRYNTFHLDGRRRAVGRGEIKVGMETTKGHDHTVIGLGVGANLVNQDPKLEILPRGYKTDLVAMRR